MLNNKALSFLKNFSYTISSNLINMIVSVLVVFIVPKLLGVDEYGYWQLFLFYSSYVPFLLFGWTDGIYLRYGGWEYDELDKKLFFSQFIQLLFVQIIIGICICLFSDLFILHSHKLFVFKMIALFLIIVNIRYLFIHILQGTNRFKSYAKIIMIDRLFYMILITLFLILGLREFELLIISDIIGKFISLLYAIYKCSDIVIQKISNFYFCFKESLININVGIKLMLANTVSMLIIGIIRFGIEQSWDIVTFGKISLTLNISNFLMIFINSVGLILFPILRRTSVEKLPTIYNSFRTLLMVIILGFLILYFPINIILSAWLPGYTDSLKYMSLLFPMVIYEGKMSLLINTYLKTLRKEQYMLGINLFTLFISIFVSFITIILFQNLEFVIGSIVIILAIKSVLAEVFLSKQIGVTVSKDIIYELILTFIFIFSTWFLSAWLSILIYIMSYLFYLFIKHKDIKSTIFNFMILLKD